MLRYVVATHHEAKELNLISLASISFDTWETNKPRNQRAFLLASERPFVLWQ